MQPYQNVDSPGPAGASLEAMGTVIDLDTYRRRRQARHEIVQIANRIRLERSRYVRAHTRREVAAPKVLTLRNLEQAVWIVRHWRAVDNATLAAAGFGPVGPDGRLAVAADLMDAA